MTPSDDIVTLLRKYQPYSKLHGQAADEIERLRTAGDSLDNTIRTGVGIDDALDVWEEARRG